LVDLALPTLGIAALVHLRAFIPQSRMDSPLLHASLAGVAFWHDDFLFDVTHDMRKSGLIYSIQ
jgi:hypothetical protein